MYEVNDSIQSGQRKMVEILAGYTFKASVANQLLATEHAPAIRALVLFLDG